MDALADWLRVCVPLAVPDKLGVADKLGDDETEALWVLLSVCVELRLDVSDAVTLGEPDALGVRVSDADGVAEELEVSDKLALGELEALEVADCEDDND